MTFEFEVKIINDSRYHNTTFDVDARVEKPSGPALIDWTNVDTDVYLGTQSNVTKTYSLTYSSPGNLPNNLTPLKVKIRLNQDFGPTLEEGKSPAVTNLGAPVQTNASLVVTDSFAGVGPWTFTNSGGKTYNRTIQSGSVSGTHTVENIVTGDYMGISDSATVTVTTKNEIPVAKDQTLNTPEDTSKSLVLTGTDGDPSQTISFTDVGTPANGTLSGTAPNLTYTPNSNWNGTDSFTFRVFDGYEYSNTGTITIIVGAVDDLPIANDDSVSTDEDTEINISVLANDIDVDGDAITITGFTQPSSGLVTDNLDGTLKYKPIANFSGTVEFVYTVNGGDTAKVTVVVNPTNDAPVAANDAYSTDEDVTLNVDALLGLLKNDTDIENNSLSAVLDTNVTNGTLTLNADGSFTYAPKANFNGTDTFTYHATDGTDSSNQATVTITVNPINDAPVAVADSYTTAEDTQLVVTLPGILGNDSDVDGDAFTLSLVSNVSHGTLVLNADGSFTYTPNADWVGLDTFTYKINDSLLDSSVVAVDIDVTPVNDAPVAADDTYTTNEDITLNVDALNGLLKNDTDKENDTLSAVLDVNVTNGVLTLNADGSFSYVPNANFNGTDTFKYHVNDGDDDSNQATVTITVLSVNDAPVAANDIYNINEDTMLTVVAGLGVLANDTDPEGGSLTAAKLTNPSHGLILYFLGNGSFGYLPNPNFHGTDSFTYKAIDSNGLFTNATVTINVASINDRPKAWPNSFITNEDTALLFTVGDLLANDTDADNDSLTITNYTQPSSGLLTLVGNQFTYLPIPNFFGPVTFNYTISDGNGGTDSATVFITVLPINDAPIAVDDVYNINEDEVLTISTFGAGILANDSDVDNLLLFASLLPGGEPTKGTVTVNLNGTFTYTPNADATGTDTFIYKVRDAFGASDLGLVTINIAPLNDAPVAVGDTYTTAEDTALVIPAPGIIFNDVDADGDALAVVLVSNVSNGTLVLNADGSFTYTPNANFVGLDSFTYKVNDSLLDSNVVTVDIDVTPVNDPPVANPLAFTVANAGTNSGSVTATDIDLPADALTFSLLTAPTNGSVTVSPTGAYVYTHNGSATLSDSFVFSVTDGNLSSTATVTITVLAAPTPPPVPVNLPPVANPLSFTIANDALSTGTLTGSDPEGATLTFTLVTSPVNGSILLSPAGVYTYNHNGTATTTDSFVFSVSDGSLSANATVSITILPIPAPGNTAPVVVNTTLTTDFESPIDGSVSGSDADGDPLTYSLVDGPTNGTIVFNPDGTFTYTPDTGFNGNDSFTFIANDGTDDSNVGTFTISVNEEELVEVTPEETPLAALPFPWLSWLAAALAAFLAWLLAFLRPNMKYTLTDGANNQKVIRRRLSKPDGNAMLVELNDKDMVNLQTINVELYKRLAKHCGNVTVNFQLNGKVVHSVTIPEGISDSFETLIRL